jgi:ubiquinone/menaquinone biosynthesis C-methylase UbiE
MMLSASLFVGILGAVFIAMVIWRFSSQRHQLPCPVWLRWFVEIDNPFTKTNRAAFIIDTLAIEAGMKILDAGCGPGRLTIPLAQRVGPAGKVIAMDMQLGMLNRTQDKAEAAGLANIEYLHAGLGESRLPCNRFERAVLVTVLGEIPDRTAAVAELFNALKPGGILAVVELIFDPHFQTRKTVTDFAFAAGFLEKEFWGNRIAYIAHFQKPSGKD